MLGRRVRKPRIQRGEPSADALFVTRRAGTVALLLLVAASGALMILDQKTVWLVQVRAVIGTALNPLDLLARTPYTAADWAADTFVERAALHDRVADLERENLELHAALLRADALARENDRLRALFNSQAPLQHETLIAELIGLSEEPKEVILDKGARHGVRNDQPVIDSNGLFGQIVETTAFTSRVRLVNDPSHAVPVYVLRNGVRAFAVGDGGGQLTLKHAAATLDVRVGDALHCSGLGGRFPFGYPVGVVTAATRDVAEPFLHTTIQPSAALDRSRHLLILMRVRSGQPDQTVDGAT